MLESFRIRERLTFASLIHRNILKHLINMCTTPGPRRLLAFGASDSHTHFLICNSNKKYILKYVYQPYLYILSRYKLNSPSILIFVPISPRIISQIFSNFSSICLSVAYFISFFCESVLIILFYPVNSFLEYSMF